VLGTNGLAEFSTSKRNNGLRNPRHAFNEQEGCATCQRFVLMARRLLRYALGPVMKICAPMYIAIGNEGGAPGAGGYWFVHTAPLK
jgi:hypothetical protein